ncbi:MAG: tRNA 2-selenouridine(34) synthase MnmH [Verrucomicrobiota bacterium JB025]|nr:tRNA 2-selenouridine(34) synthase MnmH [Verrucomicrobiota bacterium JB025]
MARSLSVDDFLDRSDGAVVVDVRTPDEFAKGHIPGAVNVPLFSNEERAEIGTAYKRQGRKPAVSLGLRFLGPRMEEFAEELLALAGGGERPLHVHCWRGGMRSGSVAWLMESAYDCRVAVLKGGYKRFRNWVLGSFSLPRNLRVVSGLTGCKKTAILHRMEEMGECVVDLEGLANHKGSAFGSLGEEPQPTQAQFENDLAVAWRALDPQRVVWVEDESRMVGRRVIPQEIWELKQQAPYHVVEIPEEERVGHLCGVYGNHTAEELEERVVMIRSRLGDARAREAVDAIRDGDIAGACRVLLFYYDRNYQKSINAIADERRMVHRFEHADPGLIARSLVDSLTSES